MSKALVPSQPTPTEIALILRGMSGKAPEFQRAASSNGGSLVFWHDIGEITVRLECEYGYATTDIRTHRAPVEGLLLQAASKRWGQEIVSRIARAFGGFVLDETGIHPTWVEVQREDAAEVCADDRSRIAVESCLSADEAVALSTLLGDARRLAKVVPLLARHAATLDPLAVEIRQADFAIESIEVALANTTPGPYRGVDASALNAPASCIDFGVVSDSAGSEVSRVWNEGDARYQVATQPERIVEVIEAYRKMAAWNQALASLEGIR